MLDSMKPRFLALPTRHLLGCSLLVAIAVQFTPFTVGVVLFCRLFRLILFTPGTRVQPVKKERTVLISGAHLSHALILCRAFSRSGWRVILIDERRWWSTSSRWSRYVDTYISSPNCSDKALYIQAYTEVIEREGISLFIEISTPRNAKVDGPMRRYLLHHFPRLQYFSLDTKLITDRQFDPEMESAVKTQREGRKICVAESLLATSHLFAARHLMRPNRIGRRYLYRSIGSENDCDWWRKGPCEVLLMQSSQDTFRQLAYLDISPQRPALFVEDLTGHRLSVHLVCHEGSITAFSELSCVTKSTSSFNVNLDSGYPEIRGFLQDYVKARDITGQFSLQFIDTEDDKLWLTWSDVNASHDLVFLRQHRNLASLYSAEQVASPASPGPQPDVPSLFSRLRIWRFSKGYGAVQTLQGMSMRLEQSIDVLRRTKNFIDLSVSMPVNALRRAEDLVRRADPSLSVKASSYENITIHEKRDLPRPLNTAIQPDAETLPRRHFGEIMLNNLGRVPPLSTFLFIYQLTRNLLGAIISPARFMSQIFLHIAMTFDLDDPVPSVVLYHFTLPLLILYALWNGKEWNTMDITTLTLEQTATPLYIVVDRKEGNSGTAAEQRYWQPTQGDKATLSAHADQS